VTEDPDPASTPAGGAVVASLPYPYLRLNRAGEIQRVNEAWEASVEYDESTMRGQRFAEYVVDDDSEDLRGAFRSVRSGEAVDPVELGLQRASGGSISVPVAISAERTDEGTIRCMHCQFPEESTPTTIGGDGEPEDGQAVDPTEERMKLAVEGAKLGIWDWNMATDEVYRDELLTTMLGYSPEEMGDRLEDWERLVHPDGKRRHDEALAEHVADETPFYECDYRMKTSSGDWKWVRTMGTVVEWEDGTPVRAVGIHLDIDEQKRAKRALREERDMFAQGPAVAFQWMDREGWPIQYVSENVETVLGYDPARLQSEETPFADLVHEDDLEGLAESLEKHRDRGDDRFDPEAYRIRTAEGGVRWVKEYTHNLQAEEEDSHLVGYVLDVTELKEQERELRERERKYRTLFENTRDALMLMDEDGYIDCNERALNLFGVSSVEEFLQYSPWELSPETQPDGRDSAEAATERIRDAIETGEAFFEWTHERADGTEFPAEVKLSRFEYDAEPVVQALVRDITERRERERQLAEREEKYRHLFEDTRDALMLLDRDGFFDCNETTLDLFGAESVEEFVEYTPWELSPATQPDGTDSNAAALAYVDRAFEEGEALFEWTHERIDGTEFPAEVKLSKFQADGEPKLHALVRDITERKAYEERLETQRDDLEVLNRVLRHDIRNDLQLVIAYADQVEDASDGGEVQEYARTIHENAGHAVELTTRAREMAEVMVSSDDDVTPIALRGVLEEELTEVRSAYPDATVTVESEIPDVRVEASDMLGSVFRNLLKNAHHHNDKDHPRVCVSARTTEDSVLVRIADNGPGVPDDRKETIFGKGETGLESSGTGIGLYLVNTLVGSYGGEVWVEDNDPEGAEFVVALPYVDHQ